MHSSGPNSSRSGLGFIPSSSLGCRLKVLLSSQPLCLRASRLPFIGDSILGCNVESSMCNISTNRRDSTIGNRVSSEVLVVLQHCRPQLRRPIIRRLSDSRSCSFFSIATLFFEGEMGLYVG